MISKPKPLLNSTSTQSRGHRSASLAASTPNMAPDTSKSAMIRAEKKSERPHQPKRQLFMPVSVLAGHHTCTNCLRMVSKAYSKAAGDDSAEFPSAMPEFTCSFDKAGSIRCNGCRKTSKDTQCSSPIALMEGDTRDMFAVFKLFNTVIEPKPGASFEGVGDENRKALVKAAAAVLARFVRIDTVIRREWGIMGSLEATVEPRAAWRNYVQMRRKMRLDAVTPHLRQRRSSLEDFLRLRLQADDPNYVAWLSEMGQAYKTWVNVLESVFGAGTAKFDMYEDRFPDCGETE